MAKSLARRTREAAMRAKLRAMFAEAGTTFEARPDGRVAVTNWPQGSRAFGDGSFIQRERESFHAQKAQDRAICAAEGHQPYGDPANVCRRCGDPIEEV